jgi:hypothetical protein
LRFEEVLLFDPVLKLKKTEELLKEYSFSDLIEPELVGNKVVFKSRTNVPLSENFLRYTTKNTITSEKLFSAHFQPNFEQRILEVSSLIANIVIIDIQVQARPRNETSLYPLYALQQFRKFEVKLLFNSRLV